MCRLTRITVWGGLLLLTLSLQHCGLDWRESYRIDRENPYDLYVLHQLLEDRPEGLTVVEDSLKILRQRSEHANYLFVGQYAHYSEQSITELLDFVEKGNTAFIAAYELPAELAAHLYGLDCYAPFDDTYYDPDFHFLQLDTSKLSLPESDSTYLLVQHWDFEPIPRNTYFVPDDYLCDPEIDNEIIGRIDGLYANFVRLNWGAGNFYFHTNPIFFTNYFLVDTVGRGPTYAAGVLDRLGTGHVYWDEYSRVPPPIARKRNNRNNQQAGRGYNGGRNLLTGNEALSYIQEQPPLALAWYTLLLAALLYVIIRGRRRQRIIPEILPRENSSKRFIDTISRLVYQKGNHQALARQELNNLRFFLQDRFGLRWKEGEPPPENLGELIGAPPAVARQALIEIRIVQKKKVLEEHTLLRFYRAIEPLYQL